MVGGTLGERERAVRRLERGRVGARLVRGLAQVGEQLGHASRSVPLLREGERHLTDLDGLEGLLEDEQSMAASEARDGLLVAVVGPRRAQDDLEVRIVLPEARHRLDAVDPRRHAHVHEGHVEAGGTTRQLAGLLALMGVDELALEAAPRTGAARVGVRRCAHRLRLGCGPEERRARVGDRAGGRGVAAEDLGVGVVDARVVVDQQDAVGAAHAARMWLADASLSRVVRVRGRSRRKRAPWPRPSEVAVRVAPISRAAFAAVCRPKPCPSGRVV